MTSERYPMMRSRFVPRTACAILLTGCALAASPLALHASGEEILWLDATRGVAAFVPESRLGGNELAAAPLATIDRERLAAWSTGRDADAKGATCVPVRSASPAGSAVDATSLPALLARSPQVVLATVSSISAGYSPWYGTAARRITVRVEQVLRGTGISVGDEVSYVAPGGTFRFGAGKVCATPAPGFTEPRGGERLLLSGARAPEVPELFAAALVFPVTAGTVQPQPYPTLEKAAKPVALDVLATALSAAEVKP